MSSLAKAVFWITTATILSLGLARAQDANPLPRHPGEVIKYEIKLDGPNAGRIKTVDASMNTGVAPPKDQAGFTNGFGTQHPFTPSSPGTFVVEMTIPDNAATGDYRLYVYAQADEGRASYSDGQEFHVPAVHIENPKKFTPPSITVKPLP